MRGCTLSIVGLAALVLAVSGLPADAQYYRSHAEIGQILLDAETDYPSICQRYDLGSSVQGRSIWALRISDNVTAEEDEPEFKYISTMHGNEIVGNEMCLYLIEHMTTNYGSDPTITNLVDEIEIWIVPLMNPDGYEASPRTRRNANNIDLNRDFPDPFTSPDNTPTGRAVETGVIMNWSSARSFTLSANIHTGALVVNYPFDNNPEAASVYTASPDDDMFIWISEEYSQYNSPMWNGSFYHGITNGADWYRIAGGMQDWSYRYMGCNEVTLEISNSQSPYPNASELPTYWDNNRDSMLAYLATCLIGVRGIVTNASTGGPLKATVTVEGRDHEVYTDPNVGDYHRMLLPGTYAVTASRSGYDSLTNPNIVVSEGDATRWDVALGPLTEVAAPNGGETLEAGVATTVSWTGNSVASFHVQYSDNYGDTTWLDDLEAIEDHTTWSDVTALTAVGATSTSWVPPAEGTDYKVRVRVEYADGSYGSWDESDDTFTVLPYSGGDIPTVSEWGMIVLALLILTAETIIFQRSRAVCWRRQPGGGECPQGSG